MVDAPYGRASGELVTMMVQGEIEKEHLGADIEIDETTENENEC